MYWIIIYILVVLVVWAIFYGGSCDCEYCDIYNSPDADRSHCFGCEGRRRK